MKVCVEKTEIFSENIKSTSKKLNDIKDDLHRLKIKLSDGQTEVDNIVIRITKIEAKMEETLYTLLKMRVAAERISEMFVCSEDNIKKRAEYKQADKAVAPKIDYIDMHNVILFKGVMKNGENNKY